MTSTDDTAPSAPIADAEHPPGGYAAELERATRGLLELNVTALEQLERKVGLAPLRALQSLQRLGPSLVTKLGNDLDLLVSTASRLSDRLAEAGLITRRVSPTNRRATLLELTDAGRAVLDELVLTRTHSLSAVTERMSQRDRTALINGARAFARAFAAAHQRGSDAPEDDGSPAQRTARRST